VGQACLHHPARLDATIGTPIPPTTQRAAEAALSVYVGNVPGTSKAGEEVLPMNRGIIGTIIGVLVIIILVIVILQLT